MKHLLRPVLSVLLIFAIACCPSAYELPFRYNPQSDVFRYFKTDEKKLALTFDDGPHPTDTDTILGILEEYQVKATFFQIGINISYYPEVAKRVADAGHEIGNHTFSHEEIAKKNRRAVREEIAQQAAVLEKTCGVKSMFFRPPGGCCKHEVLRAAEDCGMTIVLWSIDTRDWAHSAPEIITEEVVNTARAGDIILFHDYVSSGNSPTPAALRKIIPAMLAKGYTFVTVSELLGADT